MTVYKTNEYLNMKMHAMDDVEHLFLSDFNKRPVLFLKHKHCMVGNF